MSRTKTTATTTTTTPITPASSFPSSSSSFTRSTSSSQSQSTPDQLENLLALLSTDPRASPRPPSSSSSGRSSNSMPWNGHRNGNGNGNGRHFGRNKVAGDVVKYQFWPNMMAMGSLIGNRFTQTFGAYCKSGPDPKRDGHGESYLAFDFTRELFAIRTTFDRISPHNLPPTFRPLDAELTFDDISSHGIHVFDTFGGFENGRKMYNLVVTISCRRPPKFYAPFEQDDFDYGRIPYRRRATAMDFANSTACERDAGVLKPIPEGPCAAPTLWNTYRWIFKVHGDDLARFRECANRIHMLGMENPDMQLLSDAPARREQDLVNSTRTAPSSFEVPDLSQLQFGPRALLEGLVGHGILRPTAVGEMLEALKRHAFVPAFQERVLEACFSEDRIRNIERLVEAKATFLRRTPTKNVDHVVMVRSVRVTPTRVLVSPPQQEESNSVTRRYKDNLNAIVRVQFTDEAEKLHILDYTKQGDQIRPDVGLMARVRRALKHGILIGGQRFFPVASSSSQQKDHAIWFINNTAIDLLELHRWMGSVSETVVAKHAARMGLPFSASRMVNLDADVRRDIKDVERNGHCFTDGCSVAGIEVMRQAAESLGYTKGLNQQPSAIQFRLGGAKGVLACWPDKVAANTVCLRPSQVKFTSNLKDINVVRIAKYQVAFLNRQFIIIMSNLGLPDSLFVKLFEEAIAETKGIPERVKAGTPTKEDFNLISQFSQFPLKAMIKAGHHQNPAVLDMCRLIECRALQDLKWRARVKLPGGVFLIGICDESNTLEEGEVFCQFQESEAYQARIVTGEVVVCRAPALHPGDVRRAQAVDRPALRHLKNVIVFSVKGERPLPNMLGGGDLDGDDFTLIWDKRFLEGLRVVDAMDYTAPPPLRVNKVTQEHLNENFVQYILNDVLGQVDNCHLALSDFHSPFHDDCLKLSMIHSESVDFAKTGQAAVLDPKIMPRSWPDFMDKGVDKTYHSPKILGKIFRLVDPDPHFFPSDLKEEGYPVDARLNKFPVYPKLLDRLKPIHEFFNNAMQYSMRRFRVYEIELICAVASQNKQRKRSRDLNHLAEPLKDCYDSHVATAREAVWNLVHNISVPGSNLTPGQIAARHCYALTFEKRFVEERAAAQMEIVWGEHGDDVDKEKFRTRPMVGFALIFATELAELAASE